MSNYDFWRRQAQPEAVASADYHADQCSADTKTTLHTFTAPEMVRLAAYRTAVASHFYTDNIKRELPE